MAVYNTTPHHTTPELLPQYRVAVLWRERGFFFLKDDTDYYGDPISKIADIMRLKDKDFISRLVYDEENPDYIIATNWCFTDYDECKKFRHYLSTKNDRIFIYFTYEAIEPDLNFCDYAFTWDPDLKCGDRIIRNFSYMFDEISGAPFKNDLTLEEARKILESKPDFCSFLYSHAQEPRDSFFHLLSRYKPVTSSGPHLNNTGKRSTREDKDWYSLSVDLKSGHKFSIAMENNVFRGYTSEKIVSSLRAHTVPIYWGDPLVADYINPKAFINCGDYSSFEEVVERVKEIDNNDELWLDMVTQPWQTEEQYARTVQEAEDYDKFIRHIFSQDIAAARRRSAGRGDVVFLRDGFTGYIGKFPSLLSFLLLKVKRAIMNGDFMLKLRKLLHIAYN